MPDLGTVWIDTALRMSQYALPTAYLILSATVLAYTWCTDDHRRAWLAEAAAAMVLVSFAFRPLAPLWFTAFPLLAATFPDGRFVPRWLVAPVLVTVVPTTVELMDPDRWSDQPWWPYFAFGELLLLLAQLYRYRRRATTGSGNPSGG